MAIIKQISVFNGNSWDTDDIGVNASNVTLSSNVAGSTVLQTALNNILPASKLTASRALVSDSNQKVAVSSVTGTQLGYLSGVTSNIQTQINTINTNLNGKAPTSHASTTTTYGRASQDYFGHAKVNNTLTVSTHDAGIALSAYQGYLLNQNKVAKTGDNMTGSLRILGTDTVGTSPSSNYFSPALNVGDKNGTVISYLNHAYYTNGTLATQLGSQRNVSGSMKYNTLLLGIDTSGNATIGLSGTNIVNAWRSALGLVQPFKIATATSSSFTQTGELNGWYTGRATITAPTVSGYTFKCWIAFCSDGWIGSIYAGTPVTANPYIYCITAATLPNNNRKCTGYAIYCPNT